MIGRLRVQIPLSATWFLPSDRRIKLVICVCAILAPDIKRVAEILKLTIQPSFNVGTRAYIIVHIGYTLTSLVVIGYPPMRLRLVYQRLAMSVQVLCDIRQN